MCGIASYVGKNDAVENVMNSLSYLEYRGYDSAGVAFFDKGGKIHTVKTAGKTDVLKSKLSLLNCKSTCCIGHTRWATHGIADETNAHPHTAGKVTIVHNGIIENFLTLRDFLKKEGYGFKSHTDTEVCAAFMDYFYCKSHNPFDAILETTQKLCGSFAICALFEDKPNEIYAFKKESPLFAAKTSDGCFAVSDVSALPRSAKAYVQLKAGEVARIDGQGMGFFDFNGFSVRKEEVPFAHSDTTDDKGEYEHYMLKEIFEEPEVIEKTIRMFPFSEIRQKLNSEAVTAVHIVGCGSAFNAASCALYDIRKMTGLDVRVHIASEFRYFTPPLSDNDLIILVSQSGETADTLAALRLAKDRGLRTMAVVNAKDSAICREADIALCTCAGKEVSVASTKAYSVQLCALYLIGSKILSARVSDDRDVLEKDLSRLIRNAFDKQGECIDLARKLKDSRDIFFIGRGRDFALALEAALKIKEVSYIHCEAYPAGELKHGSIALIEDGVPVVAFVTCPDTKEKMIGNISEVRARGAFVAAFVSDGIEINDEDCDMILKIPPVCDTLVPLVCAPLIQLTAYHTARLKDLNPDRPRNLAKSVTVE